jgi:trans-aconitate methyltransferase
VPPHLPERLTWTADLLDVQPADVVLEIGCGSGALAELICTRLSEGHLVAIDRSATLIAAAGSAVCVMADCLSM